MHFGLRPFIQCGIKQKLLYKTMSILKSIATQQKKYMYNKIKSIMQAIMVLLWKD